jgi:hypothetical protein
MKLLNILSENITTPPTILVEEVEKKPPRVRVIDNLKVPTRINISAKGQFDKNNTQSTEDLLNAVFNTLQKDSTRFNQWMKDPTIDVNLQAKKLRSGASNHYCKKGMKEGENCIVKPETPNAQNIPITPLPVGQDYNGDAQRNKALAVNRGVNFWNAFKKRVTDENIKITKAPILDETAGVIVDTGGKVDSERLEKKYPNPGQFVWLQLVLDATKKPKKQEAASKEQIQSRNCVTGMKVSVVYYDDERSGCKDKNDNKGGCHICNDAKFQVYLNETFIGTANLNNAQMETQEGQTGSGYGGSRKSTFLVSEESARKITQSKVDMKGNQIPAGSVVLAIKGINQTSNGVHADVPWIILTTGQGKVIYNQLARGKETWGRGNIDIHNLIGPFNPCKKITT